MRVQVMFDGLDASGGRRQGMRHQIFHAEEKHQQKTDEFHGRFDPAGVEQVREAPRTRWRNRSPP